MDITTPTLAILFDELGLASDQQSIDNFVQQHRLQDEVKLVDAEFWTPHQAAFLKEGLRLDDDWAPVVDELNILLHPTK